jgi:predicted NBD/HSP70 family sugar kinase
LTNQATNATTGHGRRDRVGPGEVLRVIRGAGEITRNELMAHTGLGRSTISQRIEALVARGLVFEVGEGPSTGGRPPSTLMFNPQAGFVFAADLGATHARVAIADLAGEALAEITAEVEIASGPKQVIGWLEECFEQLLETSGNAADTVRAIGIGVPGPVEFATGRPVSPPIMPGWDGHPIPEHLQQRYPVPVLVDNDVNIMGLGEQTSIWPQCEHLLYVKVGTGIGCGIVSKGKVYRGAQGAAGDIGHIRLADHSEVLCECGNVGCLEAVAGGRALVREIRKYGLEATTSRDVAQLVRSQNRDAVRLVRQAGRNLGEVLAMLVNALNPEIIVIGGDLAVEQLFAGVREIVYQRSTALATRHLQILPSALADRAGITGAATLAIERVLAPDAVDGAFPSIAASSPG